MALWNETEVCPLRAGTAEVEAVRVDKRKNEVKAIAGFIPLKPSPVDWIEEEVTRA